MDSLATKNGAKLHVAYIPANFEVYPELAAKAFPLGTYIPSVLPGGFGGYICNKIERQSRVACLDLTKKMSFAIKNSTTSRDMLLSKNFLYPAHGEIHLSKSGSKFSADMIYRFTQ
jgi:hypothetical protein